MIRFLRSVRLAAAAVFAGALAAAAAATPAAARAQAGTVTFANTGNGGAVVPIFSGPVLVQTGRVRSGFGGADSVGGLASWGAPEYSGGGPTVYGSFNSAGTVAEFALSGASGNSLGFTSASFGGWPNTARFIRVRLFDAGFAELFNQILSVPASPQQAISFGGVTTSSGTLRLQFTEVTAAGAATGRGAFDVGFSSLSYTAGGTAIVIPEPSTYALVAAGLAGVGALARRRRAAASPA